MKVIKIACETRDNADLDKFIELQGNLKSLSDEAYKKLRREIVQTGFAFPLLVWIDPKDKSLKVCGGHQRLRALKMMRDEGAVIPKIPYVKIHADNLKEAKRRVLQDLSQYGSIESSGLDEFMKEAKMNLEFLEESFNLPDFDMDVFQKAFYPEPPKKVEFLAKPSDKNEEEKEEDKNGPVLHICPRCGHKFG